MQQHGACEHYGNSMRQEQPVPRTPAKQAISTLPPRNVANAAARGLRLREQHGRGGTAIGVARARDLSAQTSLSTQTIRRMHAYFARHSVDKNAKGWADRSAPSAGYIAWLLWGGDAGQRWAARLYQRLQDAASAKTKAGKGTGTSNTAAAGASGTKTRTAGKTAAKRTARKTAAKKAARNTTGTASAKKPSARKGAAGKAAAGSAATSTSRSSTGARKATGTTAANKAAVKKTAARKTTVKKATAKKRPAKKTATKKTAARRPAASKSASTRSTAKKGEGKAPAPWNKPNPKRTRRSSSLSPAQKTQARQRAKAAGRPYPNLVDNMAVARKGSAAKRAGGAGAAKRTGTH
ncbi:DNA-binding protein [Xanthomonas euroxanthea]|uniref:DNA-binding protein n=1 Tax=Xanthomonas euroxanthea TaxID=2259622 RepID=UPI001BB01281|nr:DNA-binding protein [Xanthomonas euroxanthea]